MRSHSLASWFCLGAEVMLYLFQLSSLCSYMSSKLELCCPEILGQDGLLYDTQLQHSIATKQLVLCPLNLPADTVS